MTSLKVRGGASAEEIAAVVAAVCAATVDGRPAESGYDHWRRQRLAALRPSGSITFYSPVAGLRPTTRRIPGKA